jgi:hypothetical protein
MFLKKEKEAGGAKAYHCLKAALSTEWEACENIKSPGREVEAFL